MKLRFRFIHFCQAESLFTPADATEVEWECRNNRTNALLGCVEFYPEWREYVFTPAPDCIFSSGCLRDIQAFMDGLGK